MPFNPETGENETSALEDLFPETKPKTETSQKQTKTETVPPKRTFPLTRWRDIRPGEEPNYCVKGLIPREGLVVIYGPPKCGKTFWTFDLVSHIALAWPYRGRRVEAGTVVYIAVEGERGLAARKEAFQQAKLGEDADPPFFLLTTRLDLPAQVDALIPDIADQIPKGEPVACIVLDTLNRSIGGSENKDEDMTAYIAAADTLRERFRCAVIIIHHTGIDGSRPRAHTSLTGAVDAQLAVKRIASGLISVTLEWMKDGVEGVELVSKLKVVELGQDDNGEMITSCIIEPVDGASDAPMKTRKKLTGTAKLGLQQLADCEGKYVTEVPYSDHVPKDAKCIPLQLWYKYLVKAGLVNEDGSPREQFRRIRVTLQEHGYIGAWNDYVWINS